MPPKTFKTKIHCSICGCEFETLVRDGHIVYPHICNDCMRKIILEYENKEEPDEKQ